MKVNAIEPTKIKWAKHKYEEKQVKVIFHNPEISRLSYCLAADGLPYEVDSRDLEILKSPRDCEGELLKMGDRVEYDKKEYTFHGISSGALICLFNGNADTIIHPHVCKKLTPKLIKDLPESEQHDAMRIWLIKQDYTVLSRYPNTYMDNQFDHALSARMKDSWLFRGALVYKDNPGEGLPELIGPILEQEVV